MTFTLSGYRAMWMMVQFDLPTGTRAERKRASDFRNLLHDLGFSMNQFSIYLRFCASREQADPLIRAIERAIPKAGRISILFFTDKQYENSLHFNGPARDHGPKKPEQLPLF